MEPGRDKTVKEIVGRLKGARAGEAVRAEGTWGSFAAMLAGYISKKLSRSILYVSGHIDDADKVVDDLHTFGAKRVETLSAWEGAEDIADATDEIRADRLRVTLKILAEKDSLTAAGMNGGDLRRGRSGKKGAVCEKEAAVAEKSAEKLIIVAPVQALCQPIAKPEVLAASTLSLEVDKELSPEGLVEWLIENGFEAVEGIDLPGQFARRGGIVDIFAPVLSTMVSANKQGQIETRLGGEAIRVEFFADTVESIRRIDLDTLRSTEVIRRAEVVSAVRGGSVEERELLVNILPGDTIVICEESPTIEEVANVYLERVETAETLYNWADIYKGLANFAQLHICRFGAGQQGYLKLPVKGVQQFQRKAVNLWAGHKAALEELVAEAKAGRKVLLYCERSAEIKRVTEIIEQGEQKVPVNFRMLKGYINQGFMISSLKTIVISHHELFGQYALRRRQRPVRASAPLDTLADLQAGDYVVHTSYGIGKFLGIETIAEKGMPSEYLTLEYADGVKVHVSVHNITLVQKYIGTRPKRPKLSKVGSKRWQRQKEQAARGVQDMAEELLKVQAKRQAMGGVAFGADCAWQVEFEESFAYEATADQITAAEEIKADMRRAVAMDRLVCGDVGYGKTELAMRAAFKTVAGGRQAAVLVPTTVLCVQHGRTFTERFADFPISIEILNRFKTGRQAADIIRRTKQGRVDVLIGTHRLLSGDVGFSDLGLLIIDEEQRFGVEHKERLKRLKVNVDVLTMTATPIPRTLHMSMLGLRDISSLGTPPLDRRAVVTTVTAYNKDLIRKGIIRELNRGGQVFFLHNRVKTIEKKAWEIRRLISDTGARTAIAHGRMAKSELEKTMIDFVTGKVDILVCTTIIESGLDIPNANTIFIDNADRFGLAELHQLRGRVGRYKHRAYAYMLLPPARPITPIAARRLKAIEEYSHLGAGFRIALRDLEIRGAGNILGSEQSGHIQTVGYRMYCELLADAVRRLRKEAVEAGPAAVIELGFSTYIPRNYIPLDRYRMDAYRKIASAKSGEELRQIVGELADIYGPVPDEVGLLLELAELRIVAGEWGVKAIGVSGQDLVFSFSEDAGGKARELFAKTAGTSRIADSKTAYLRLRKNYFEPTTLLNILRKMFGTRGMYEM